MAHLEAWVRNIVVLILFGTLLELAIPDSAMRKTLRLVLGLIIMLALLRPVVALFQHGGSVPFLPAGRANFAQNSVIEGRRLWGENLSLVAASYRDQLEKTAKAIAQQDGVKPSSVTVRLGSAQNYGRIRYIRLNLAPGSSATDSSRVQAAESTYFDLQPSQIQMVY